MKLDDTLVEALRRERALTRGATFVAACSAGVDSTVLGHVLAGIALSWDVRVILGYVHHGLRVEAEAEREHVRRFATDLGVGFLTRTVSVLTEPDAHGGSLQAVARRLRYAALEGMREEAGADWILTAHHADDQAETVLLRTIAGAGPQGLAGIRRRNGRVIRPLLDATREDILAYARGHDLVWREDASNANDAYRRNALRMHVLPLIRTHLNPGIASTLGRTASLFTALGEFLDARTQAISEDVMAPGENGVSLAVKRLAGYFEFERLLVIRHAITVVSGHHPSHDDVLAVERLLSLRSGARAEGSRGVVSCRDGDSIVIHAAEARHPDPITVKLGQVVAYGAGVFGSREARRDEVHFDRNAAVEWVDLDTAGSSWTLRPWRAGDRFRPLGLGADKRVSDILTDGRISGLERSMHPVLERNGEIVWVCGVRIDERVRITDTTVHIGCLEYRVIDGQ